MRVSLRASAAARRVRIPDPWSADALIENVGDQRGREILLLTRPAERDSITGTVIALQDLDVIVIREDLTGIHREHVICHELAHLLAGHAQAPEAMFEGQGLAGAAAIMLHRQCDHGDAREREAEALAEMLLRRASRAARPGYAAGLP